ncbi:hypothetical protein [Erwinia sp. Leaf53]|uniref:hypothetical protein n=1 Tax=Erwinia sp. Leaf53 TaxID=1736225 RepID=UPI00092ECE9B|nr:hypothetical protein [Erwinia sp. Leaf53]
MNISHFKSDIAPKLGSYILTYSSYPNGDFGSLERVEFSGNNLIGTLDFWSQGWLDINVYDCQQDEGLINRYYKPENIVEQEEALRSLCKILVDNK